MNIENRMNDVVKLRANICQNLAKMFFPCDWREKLVKTINDSLGTKNEHKYKEAYNDIQNIGLENYTIEEMDVTLINYLFQNANFCITSSKFRRMMRIVTNDRNSISHCSSNESPKELYINAIISLNNLKNLISNDYSEGMKIDCNEYSKFRRDYFSKIIDLQDLLLEECAELISFDKQFDKDIKWCIERPEVLNERFFIARKKYREMDREIYIRFLIKGCDAKISVAYYLYVDEMISLINNNDYYTTTEQKDKYGNNIEQIEEKLILFLNSNYRPDLIESDLYEYLKYLLDKDIDIYKKQELLDAIKPTKRSVIIDSDKLIIAHLEDDLMYSDVGYSKKNNKISVV